jgi:hypothetical protein
MMLQEITAEGEFGLMELEAGQNTSRFTESEFPIRPPVERQGTDRLLEIWALLISSTSQDHLPLPDIANETVLTGMHSSRLVEYEQIVEHDVIAQLSPKEKYTITLEIRSVRKAEPKIVEPDWA